MKMQILGSADVPSAGFFAIADEDVGAPKNRIHQFLSNKIFMKV